MMTGRATAQVSGQPASHDITVSMLTPSVRNDDMLEITKDMIPDMIRLNAIFEKRAGIIEGSFLTRLQLLALTTSNQIGAGHDLINYCVSK